MGYVMRLSAGGNIRPRAGTETTPTAPLELTQEMLTATAALRASKSTGQLSAHKAQQRVLRLEHQLYCEQQRREQAHRDLDATLATVPAFDDLELEHLDL